MKRIIILGIIAGLLFVLILNGCEERLPRTHGTPSPSPGVTPTSTSAETPTPISTYATPTLIPITVTPTPNATVYKYFLYVANSNSNTISIYSLNPSNGDLSLVGICDTLGKEPNSLTIDPTGRFLYVANTNLSDDPSGYFVAAFKINQTSGDLTHIGSFPTGKYPNWVALDASGRYLYTSNLVSSITQFRINLTTGALAPIGTMESMGSYANSISYVPNSNYIYVLNKNSNNVARFQVSIDTGALASSGITTSVGSIPEKVVTDPTGSYAYVLSSSYISMYQIDASGDLISNNVVSMGSSLKSMAFEPNCKYAFVTDSQPSGHVYICSVSTTGQLSQIGSLTAYYPREIAVDPTGNFLYVSCYSSNEILRYKIDNGTLIPMGSTATGSLPTSIAIVRLAQ